MRLRLLGAADLRQALPMADTVEAMKQAFAALSSGRAVVPQRLSVAAKKGTLLAKPGWLPGRALGAKLVSVFPGNAELGKPIVPGIVVLLDENTGEPQALLDGTFLTAWRTGAASGAATDLLARTDARVAAVFGCGAQAETQVLAIDAVRELEEIRIYARTGARVHGFVERLGAEVRAALVAAPSPRVALEGAEVICTATTSTEPVFDGADLAPGAHLNGVGSYTLDMREVDVETVRRSSVFVDSRDSALAEAGELVAAVAAGATEAARWVELGEVAAGRHPGRQSDGEITFFKSVGSAVQDLAAGALALERAEAEGLGERVEL